MALQDHSHATNHQSQNYITGLPTGNQLGASSQLRLSRWHKTSQNTRPKVSVAQHASYISGKYLNISKDRTTLQTITNLWFVLKNLSNFVVESENDAQGSCVLNWDLSLIPFHDDKAAEFIWSWVTTVSVPKVALLGCASQLRKSEGYVYFLFLSECVCAGAMSACHSMDVEENSLELVPIRVSFLWPTVGTRNSSQAMKSSYKSLNLLCHFAGTPWMCVCIIIFQVTTGLSVYNPMVN